MAINFDPNPANNTAITVGGVVMNLPKPISTVGGVVTDGAQTFPQPAQFQSPTSSVRNAGQPGGAAYAGLADVANSQANPGTVTKIVSDASGNSVHFNSPAPSQSPALQASTDSTHAVPSPVFRNPA